MIIMTLTLDQVREALTQIVDERMKQFLQAVQTSSSANDSPEYLTTKQSLVLLHVSKPTFNKLRKQGLIATYGSSEGRVLFKRAELIAFLEQNKK